MRASRPSGCFVEDDRDPLVGLGQAGVARPGRELAEPFDPALCGQPLGRGLFGFILGRAIDSVAFHDGPPMVVSMDALEATAVVSGVSGL
jgi:hypothetical protein